MTTVRQQIIELLKETSLTALDISQEVHIAEKDVYQHMPHIAKSVLGQGCSLTIDPSVCLSCGYTFKQRRRFSRPGRCPSCRKTRIRRPTFRINPTGEPPL